MKYFQVKNWEKHQHYKDRNPPWIKLHKDLIHDYEFTCLQDASKLHLMLIWLLASQMDNKIPADPKWLKNALHTNTDVDLIALSDAGFIEVDSIMLADRKQVAMPEAETEAETETKKEKKKTRFAKPTVNEIQQYIDEKNMTFSADAFFDYYESKGWKIGNTKMKSWKAACSTWQRRQKTNETNKPKRNLTAIEKVEAACGETETGCNDHQQDNFTALDAPH